MEISNSYIGGESRFRYLLNGLLRRALSMAGAVSNLPVYSRVFSGSTEEDTENWLLKFNAWASYVNIFNNGHRYGGAMRSAMEGQAESWFDALPAATKVFAR